MLNLSFVSIKEKLPEHKQEICYLRLINETSHQSTGICTGTFTYEWIEVDEEGCPTGVSIVYNDGDVKEHNWELTYYIQDEDNYPAAPDLHWMTIESFWAAIDSMT